MARPARRLGRGLNSLVSAQPEAEVDPVPVVVPSAKAEADSPGSEPPSRSGPVPGIEAQMVAVESLEPNPFQPRSDAEQSGIESLAESIERSGMLQPIAVRRHHGKLQIIAGERRWWAARSLDMAEVPIIIRDATDEQMVELALIENIQREDLNAIDRAQAYRAFCARFNVKPDEVAQRLGEDRSTVANYLRLLDLPGPIRDLVAHGEISMGHARCLLGVADEAKRWQ